MKIEVPIGRQPTVLTLPDTTAILKMKEIRSLDNPRAMVEESLLDPIACPPLAQIIATKSKHPEQIQAVVVISDATRPVPYRGDEGILWPILSTLLSQGLLAEHITILVATGTHRAMTESELREMVDPRVFSQPFVLSNHDCRNKDDLTYLGRTRRGTEVRVNRRYMEADLKILTGLVESHFMAGVSGGRKSVCPGLVGEESTHVFHGADMMASPKAVDLQLNGNPCHEEALEVAKMAGVDFICNVVLDRKFHLAGVFSGDLVEAHAQAAHMVRNQIEIPITEPFDIVITHGGFVGQNHYQTAKAAAAATPLLHRKSRWLLLADTYDQDPVGSAQYRSVLHLLKLFGPDKFQGLLRSPGWPFVPEQWQVQKWAMVFEQVPMEQLTYFSPQIGETDYPFLPGRSGLGLLPAVNPPEKDAWNAVTQAFLHDAVNHFPPNPRIALVLDGPYGIPVKQ